MSCSKIYHTTMTKSKKEQKKKTGDTKMRRNFIRSEEKVFKR